MKTTMVVAGAVLVLLGAGMAGAQESQPAGQGAAGQTVKKQTVCPVMGGAVNPDLFVDHDGKRVYFCCNGCPAEFDKAPEAYIAKLEKDGVTLDTTPVADPAKKPATAAADTSSAKDQGRSAAKGCACCK